MKKSNKGRSVQPGSRRSWLLTAAATALTAPLGGSLFCGSLTAGEPTVSVDVKQALLRGVTPVKSRTIRLRPVTAELPRAVVTAIASDPRGKYVAVAGDDHAIRILDPDTMRVVKTLTSHRDLIRTLAFDPEGNRLVSAGNDGQLIVWNRDRDFKISQRMQGTPALACVRFAPDGNELAAVGFDNKVFIVAKASSSNPSFQCDCKDLRAVAYRDDNRLLAVAGRSGDLHLFDPATGKLVFEKNIHRARIHDVEFHRDSDIVVSVAEDGMMVVFDTRRGEVMKRIRVSTGKLFAVSILDSTHVAVAGSDNVVRVVDTSEGAVVRRLEGHNGSIPTLAFHSGRLFSGGYDATFRRWSVDKITKSEERIAEGEHAIDR